VASDFFTVEAWSRTGLVTYYVLFVIDLATRRVSLCGITTHPTRRRGEVRYPIDGRATDQDGPSTQKPDQFPIHAPDHEATPIRSE
jgi:hypothetical protein